MKSHKKTILFILAISSIALLTYIPRLIVNPISIDTERFILDKLDIFLEWYANGRFSLVFLTNLFSYAQFNLLLSNILSLLFLILASLLFSFDIVKKDDKLRYIKMSIISLFILTSPLVAEQYAFTLQNVGISIGYCILILTFKLINKFIYENKKHLVLVVIPLVTFVFGIY